MQHLQALFAAAAGLQEQHCLLVFATPVAGWAAGVVRSAQNCYSLQPPADCTNGAGSCGLAFAEGHAGPKHWGGGAASWSLPRALQHTGVLQPAALQFSFVAFCRHSYVICTMKLLAGGPHGACSVALLQAHTGGLPLQLQWHSESGGEAGGAAA